MVEYHFKFQNRAKTTGNNGHDFEHFVFECFRVATGEAGFFSSLRQGRDGAIDLIDQYSEPGSITIAECKYIGTGGFTEAKARWKEVYDHLKKHLPKLAADPSLRPTSPYRTWLDPDKPIQQYRFCFTVSLTTNEVAKLEELIAADFSELAGMGVEAVRHLAEANGAVRVLSWDWFHTELLLCPALAFRWFHGLPIGVSLFKKSGRNRQSFRRFLDGSELAYFSRDNFADQGGNQVQRSESDLLDDLASGEITALVLTGPGGSGKTRLAYELARGLTDESRGFDAYWLERGASAVSVIALAKKYPAQASILLLVDYAEAAERLAEIADVVENLIEQGGHKIRVVATGRASATNKIRDDLEILNPEISSLTSQRAGGTAYLEWVTRSILKLEKIPERDALSSICRGIPALAAFAVYLFRNDRSQFDSQFGALLANDDFQSWSNKRIAILVRAHAVKERDLASLALALPLSIEQGARLQQLNADVIDLLLTDRWIENVDGQLVAAHDILADALLARWLFEAETATTDRLINLLTIAAKAQDLPHALTVIARLSYHTGFGTIEGEQILKQLLAKYPEQVMASANQLLGGPILKITEKLDLLATSPQLSELIRLNSRLHVGLAQLAEDIAIARASRVVMDVPRVIIDLLNEVCAHSTLSNFILCRAYSLDPERFRDRALENVQHFPMNEQTHFLLVRMLRAGEASEALRQAVRNWLLINGANHQSSFVYEAWLNAQGDLGAVRDKLLEWVGKHGVTPEASHVYEAWLNAQGDLGAVRDKLLEWGEKFTTLECADFVFRSWLEAGGPLADIKGCCEDWLKKNWRREDAVYLTKNLSMERDITFGTAMRIVAWAGIYSLNEDSIFRLSRVSRWLTHHYITKRASWIIRISSEAIFSQLCIRDSLSRGQRIACTTLFGNLAKRHYPKDENWPAIVQIFCHCLKHGGIFCHINRLPSNTWAVLLEDAFQFGLLDAEKDRAAIIHAQELSKLIMDSNEYSNFISKSY
ncbi:MAG: ATP-binding protein [Acetobacter sp.]|nr:ATP-binding protein [Acetobacter sp.]